MQFQSSYQTRTLPDGTRQSLPKNGRYFEIDGDQFRLIEEHPDYTQLVQVARRELSAVVWLEGGPLMLVDAIEGCLNLNLNMVARCPDDYESDLVPVVSVGPKLWSLKAHNRLVRIQQRSTHLMEVNQHDMLVRGVLKNSDDTYHQAMYAWLTGEPISSIEGVRLSLGLFDLF